MDYHDDKTLSDAGTRRKFYDRRKELELFDDCINEALTTRAVPITIALSTATYFAIREGFLKNNGILGLMRKNFLCTCVGVGVSMIGIKSEFYDKLAIFYSAHRYQEVRNMILADWKNDKNRQDAVQPFAKPNHLNLDFERPRFEGLDIFRFTEPNKIEYSQPKKYVTYEELQRKNREKYAIKHTGFS